MTRSRATPGHTPDALMATYYGQRSSAAQALLDKRGDLIAFGHPFLANPELVTRMRKGALLNAPDMATFYVPGPKGYTDYQALAA